MFFLFQGKNFLEKGIFYLRIFFQVHYAGLEKYLNSTLSVGQVTLNFCLSGALTRLPKFLNSLIIHKRKDGSHA